MRQSSQAHAAPARGAEDLIVVGAAEMYEARCRRCFEPGIPKQSEMDFVKARKAESQRSHPADEPNNYHDHNYGSE
jgi:hypothetical protein